MKLIDILVERLEEWPTINGQEVVIVQDEDSKVITYIHGDMKYDSFQWWWEENVGKGLRVWRGITGFPLAEDYQTAKITKQMWLEAKQEMNINMNKQFTKADMKDGMRFVLRNGDVHYWCEDYHCPLANKGAPYNKNFITDDLLNINNSSDLDIVKVYVLGELVWKRETLTDQEKKLKELQETIAKAEQQIKEIMGGK